MIVAACLAWMAESNSATAGDWPQFRGPNATGVAPEQGRLPADIGPDKHLLWKTPIAEGHSSPVVFGDRIYLTAHRGEQLLMLGLDRQTGKVRWEADAPYEELEEVHRVGSRATPSMAADGEHVIGFFGSSGLFGLDPDGRKLWHRPMGPFNNQHGAASSPILVGDKVITIQDHDTDAHLAAFDKQSGTQIWRTERPNFRRNYGTPVIWNGGDRPQIVVVGTAHITGYDLHTGELVWTVRGVSRVVNTTPVVGDDGKLYVVATGGGDAAEQPSFEQLLETSDANGNGLLEKDELPDSPIKNFFDQFDRDGNGSLDKEEYESIREIFHLSRSVALAIRPGGTGDITDTHVAWTYSRAIPRNSSPLYHDGHLYMVNNGGVVTCLDAETGQVRKQGRVSGTGQYYSSPVLGDGKLYLLNQDGDLSVITAEPEWKQIASAVFDEETYATPAIAAGRIYVRTVEHLYCFGLESE